MTLQTLKSYSEIQQAVPQSTQAFVEDYSALKEDVANIELSFKPLFGDQTPEGNVISNRSMIFLDTTNSPTDVTMYFNSVVGVNTGWVIVN